MVPYFADNFGNAGSIHSSGQRARAAVDAARESVASLLGAKPSEIVFTSGGTEADNLAIFGIVGIMNSMGSASESAGASQDVPKKHVITSAIEHHAVFNTCRGTRAARRRSHLRPGGFVRASSTPTIFAAPCAPKPLLITVMHANNELGTIQPIEEIGRIASRSGMSFPLRRGSVGRQAAARCESPGRRSALHFRAQNLRAQGRRRALRPLRHAASSRSFAAGMHERDRRPGTENVPGIVGLGKAAELARQHLADDASAHRRASRPPGGTLSAKSFPARSVNGDSPAACRTLRISVFPARRRSAGHRARSSRHRLLHGRGLLLRRHRAFARADGHRPFG